MRLTFRYDLPDPPEAAEAAAIAGHALGVLSRHRIAIAVVIGYGPGPLVTPLADAIREASSRSGVGLRDVLRVDEGRYWSYICRESSCCPAEGVPLDASNHPAAQAMTAAGVTVLPGREALAATLAPVTGPDAEVMAWATRRARLLHGRADPPGDQRGPASLGGPAADDSRGRRCLLRRSAGRLTISSAQGRVQPGPARPFRQLPMMKGLLDGQ